MPNCRHTRLTVVKTIRLHFNGLLSWIRKHPTLKVIVWLSLNSISILLQIIHLIRDPRFQTRSRLKFKNSFICEKGDIPGYCRSVEDDIMVGSELSASLYRLVRYEDLTRDPLAVMTDLYQFIGVNLTSEITEKIEDHFNAEKRQIKENGFNTYRKSSFRSNNPDDLPVTVQQAVDESCMNLLVLGNYTNK